MNDKTVEEYLKHRSPDELLKQWDDVEGNKENLELVLSIQTIVDQMVERHNKRELGIAE